MPPVKSIDLSASALSVPVGGVVELRATPIQANGKPSGASVAFTVVEGTATVVKTGNHTATVTLSAAGASVVRATCGSARASLTVSAPPPVVTPPPTPEPEPPPVVTEPPPVTPPPVVPPPVVTPPPPPVAGDPELPRVVPDVTMPTRTGRTITVAAGQSVQAAIDAAALGDEIVLAPGATYGESLRLRNKAGTGWLVIRSSGTLPAPGTRVAPAAAAQMPVLHAAYPSEPVIRTEPGAHHYRLIGLCITLPPGQSGHTLVEFGSDAQSTVAAAPHHLVVDRCLVRGRPDAASVRGIALNCGEAAVIDSWVEEIHAAGNGDTQAICGWNGPGPFLAQNNYLGAAGENMMLGGADAVIADLMPSDVTIRRNHFHKRPEWRGKWSVKNLFELKCARRVLVEGNVFENNWTDAQAGWGIGMLSINQGGSAPYSVVSDVTFRRNVVRGSENGINLVDRYNADGPNKSERAQRILLEDVLVLGAGRAMQSSGIVGLTVRRVVAMGATHGLIMYGTPHVGLIVEGSTLSGGGNFAVSSADGIGFGTAALAAHAPGAVFRDNVVPGVTASLFPAGAGNTYPATAPAAANAAATAATAGVSATV